jgi:glycogen synthase
MLSFEYGPFRVGGLASVLTTLCEQLADDRIQPVVAVPRSGITLASTAVAHHQSEFCTATVYMENGCEIWVLDNEVLDDGVVYPEPTESVGARKHDEFGARVAELLPVMEPDIVHLHDSFGYKCIYAARLLGLPVVYTVHRIHDHEPHSRFAEMVSVRFADAVTVVSAGYRAEQAGFFAGNPRVSVIANGVDTGFWCLDAVTPAARSARRSALTARLELMPDAPVFAYIGRMDGQQKGVEVLLDAWRESRARTMANLLLVGTGHRSVIESARALERETPERVRLVERHCELQEVRELYAAVDAVVIPSRYEPFGLVVVEAMAMGALPIASRTGGLRDIVGDIGRDAGPEESHGFGLLCPPARADALVSALDRMAGWLGDDDPRVVEWRTRAVATARLFSADRMATEYGDLYRDLMDAKGTRS